MPHALPLALALALAACGDPAPAHDAADASSEVASPCDPIAQDCPSSDKCTAQVVDEAWELMCVANGTVALGATCTRGDGPGDDDCADGFCSFYATMPPALGGARRCRALCTDSAQCQGGERCVDFGSELEPNVGLCIPACDAFSVCAAGLDCSQPDRDVAGQLFLYCRPLGGEALGETCDPNDAEHDVCGAAAVCLDVGSGAGPTCDALCDDAHPCAAGSCNVIPGAPANGGFCVPG